MSAAWRQGGRSRDRGRGGNRVDSKALAAAIGGIMPSGRWARVPPGLAWKRPGLPAGWVRVLERQPEGIAAEPGYVWLDTPGKVRHVGEHELEFTDRPPIV
jgi:hypothetical protein